MAQTYTHGLVGAVIGLKLFPDSFAIQAVCAIGAMVPDCTIVPYYIRDISLGKHPCKEQGKIQQLVSEISHSLPLLVVFIAFTFFLRGIYQDNFFKIILMFEIGVLSHIVLDVLTHKNPNRKYPIERSMMWPIKKAHLNAFAILDYRYDAGSVRPKLLEIIAIVLLILWALT